jgi:type III secretory pathway lipoprotein EscJ
MWTVIYVAQSEDGASKLQGILGEQGVLVKTRQIGKTKSQDGIFEILVPETEVEDACTILEQLGRDF